MHDRIRQFQEASIPPDAEDLLLASKYLDGALHELFRAQEPRDMRHGVETARWLLRRGHDDPDLIQAALLHDIGKDAQRRWDRVAYVAAGWLRAESLLAKNTSRWELRRAAGRSLTHAVSGAERLERAGASAGVVRLTRLHHSRAAGDGMLRLLKEADTAS